MPPRKKPAWQKPRTKWQKYIAAYSAYYGLEWLNQGERAHHAAWSYGQWKGGKAMNMEQAIRLKRPITMKKRRVILDYDLNVIYDKSDKTYLDDRHTYTYDTMKTDAEIQAVNRAYLQEVVNKKKNEAYIDEAWTSNEVIHITPYEDLPQGSLLNVPMLGLNYHYPMMGEEFVFTEPIGMCFPDYWKQFYANHKSIRAKVPDHAKLLMIMGLKTFSLGVKVENILKICEYLCCPMYALDLTNKIFRKLTPENLKEKGLKKSHDIPAMMYYLGSGHLTPIVDATMRKRIAEHAKEDHRVGITSLVKEKEKTKKEYKIVKNPTLDQVVKAKDVRFIKTKGSSLRTMLYDLRTEYKIIPEVRINKHDAVIEMYFKDRDVRIQVDSQAEVIEEICRVYQIPYEGQGIFNLTATLMAKYKSTHEKWDDRFLSILNEETERIFRQNRKRAPNLEFGTTNGFSQAIGVDHRSHYRNTLCGAKRGWSVFSIHDSLDVYDPNKGIRDGFYYVVCGNTPDDFPLRGNGWYPAEAVEEYLADELIDQDQITNELIPTKVLPADFLNDFISEFESHWVEDPLRVKKGYENSMIGCWEDMERVFKTAIFTNNLEEAGTYFHADVHKKSKYLLHTDREGEIMYEIQTPKVAQKIRETYKPLHDQLMALADLRVWRTMKVLAPKGVIVKAIRTDALYVEHPERELSLEYLGLSPLEYRVEPTKFFYSNVRPLSENVRYYYEIHDDWNDMEEDEDFDILATNIAESEQGFLITGLAGAGKSTLIRKIQEKIERAKLLAPTNKAALRIKGSTIHKFLGIAKGEDLKFNAGMAKVLKSYSCLIIDECSMLGREMLHLFDVIKKMYGLRIILVGDFFQLPPIEDDDRDYQESLAVKSLVDFNRLTLTKNRRSDDIMWNYYQQVLAGTLKTSEFQQYSWREDRTLYKHLCFRNVKRKEINAICNDRWIQEHPELPIVVITPDPKDEQGQNFRLTKGMPVIAYNNNVKMGILNNEEFIVTDLTKSMITLKSLDVEDQIVKVETSRFRFHFHLAFAMTIHKAQGQTYDQPYVIHEWNSYLPRLRQALRYVSISRTTKKDLIFFFNDT